MKYLSDHHRREVEDYMFALMNDEEMKEAYGDYRESIGETRGEARGRKLEKVNTLLESIRNIMKSLDVSAERTMDILDIPAEERAKLLEMLSQESCFTYVAVGLQFICRILHVKILHKK